MSQSNVNAVVGLQYGNEGKRCIVNYLSKNADIIIRYQGVDSSNIKAHLSEGVLNPDAMNIISAGAVIDFDKIHEAMELIKKKKDIDSDNVFFDERANILMPYHKNEVKECYNDKAAGLGLKAGDLMDDDKLIKRLETIIMEKKLKDITLDELINKCKEWKGWFGDRIIDTLPVVRDTVESGANILLEGQSGAMMDNDLGCYPYSGATNTTVAGGCAKAGIPPRAVNKVYGVAKAYTSNSSDGPYMTELKDEEGEQLREKGYEQNRRCGWFDAVATDYACFINGVTDLCLTKLDVLDTFPAIKVCIGYSINGEYYANLPETRLQESAKPIYAEFEGWMEDTSTIRSWASLPENCKIFIREIEKFLNIPITLIGVGPNEDQLIERNPEIDK